MATIVRVKRKLTEEPTEKIVISCKRHKDSSSNHDQPHKEVFKLAGTVKSKNETDLRSALGKHSIVKSQKPNTNLQQSSSQILKPHPIQSKNKKAFSVIGQQSLDWNLTLSDSSVGEQGASAVSNSVCLYDAVRNEEEQWLEPLFDAGDDDIVCNGEVMVRVKNEPGTAGDNAAMETDENGYVYDIFYLDREDGSVDFELFENILCIEAFGESYSQFVDYRHDRIYDDDNDDSNDEDNWRNEYPDEDEGNSDDEDRPYGAALYDVNDVLRFDRVRLASSEDTPSDDDDDDDVLRDYQFPENKSFERYYSSYKKTRRRERRGVGECNTSSEENDDESLSDGYDDLYN